MMQAGEHSEQREMMEKGDASVDLGEQILFHTSSKFYNNSNINSQDHLSFGNNTS